MRVRHRLSQLLQPAVEDTLQVDVESQFRISGIVLRQVHDAVFARLVFGRSLYRFRSSAKGVLMVLPLVYRYAVSVRGCEWQRTDVLRIFQRLVVYRHIRIVLLIYGVVFLPLVDIVLAVVLYAEIGLPWMVAGFARDEFLRPVHRLRLGFPKAHDVGKRKCSTDKPLAWKR